MFYTYTRALAVDPALDTQRPSNPPYIHRRTFHQFTFNTQLRLTMRFIVWLLPITLSVLTTGASPAGNSELKQSKYLAFLFVI